MTEMFGEAWSPMSVPDLAPDDDDDTRNDTNLPKIKNNFTSKRQPCSKKLVKQSIENFRMDYC